MVELCVFDVAGTTVVDDQAVASCFEVALGEEGLRPRPEEVSAVMGLPKPTAIARLVAGRVESRHQAEVARRAHARFVERMVDHYLTAPGVRAVPGAEATFGVLREAGIRVALDTGFSRRILDAVLLRLGWLHGVVDATIASDEVARGRPAPDMIHALMGKLRVRPVASVVKVGDTEADIREGLAAGCGAVVGVLSGTGRPQELVAAGACLVLPDVAGLPRWLFGAGARHEESELDGWSVARRVA